MNSRALLVEEQLVRLDDVGVVQLLLQEEGFPHQRENFFFAGSQNFHGVELAIVLDFSADFDQAVSALADNLVLVHRVDLVEAERLLRRWRFYVALMRLLLVLMLFLQLILFLRAGQNLRI